MQKVARGMHKLRVSAGLGFGGPGFSSRTPSAHVGCLVRSGLFWLHVPGNHLPVLARFSPQQRDGVALCFKPLQAENGCEIAAVLVRGSFRSHFVEVVKSTIGIAYVLCSLSV